MRMFFRILIVVLSFSSTVVFAQVTAKVVAVGTYGEGSVFVFFDTVISSCSNAQRIDLSATNPSLKNVLSVAEIAFTTGSSVIVNTATCSGATPVFTTDGASYMYLAK